MTQNIKTIDGIRLRGPAPFNLTNTEEKNLKLNLLTPYAALIQDVFFKNTFKSPLASDSPEVRITITLTKKQITVINRVNGQKMQFALNQTEATANMNQVISTIFKTAMTTLRSSAPGSNLSPMPKTPSPLLPRKASIPSPQSPPIFISQPEPKSPPSLSPKHGLSPLIIPNRSTIKNTSLSPTTPTPQISPRDTIPLSTPTPPPPHPFSSSNIPALPKDDLNTLQPISSHKNIPDVPAIENAQIKNVPDLSNREIIPLKMPSPKVSPNLDSPLLYSPTSPSPLLGDNNFPETPSTPSPSGLENQHQETFSGILDPKTPVSPEAQKDQRISPPSTPPISSPVQTFSPALFVPVEDRPKTPSPIRAPLTPIDIRISPFNSPKIDSQIQIDPFVTIKKSASEKPEEILPASPKDPSSGQERRLMLYTPAHQEGQVNEAVMPLKTDAYRLIFHPLVQSFLRHQSRFPSYRLPPLLNSSEERRLILQEKEIRSQKKVAPRRKPRPMPLQVQPEPIVSQEARRMMSATSSSQNRQRSEIEQKPQSLWNKFCKKMGEIDLTYMDAPFIVDL